MLLIGGIYVKFYLQYFDFILLWANDVTICYLYICLYVKNMRQSYRSNIFYLLTLNSKLLQVYSIQKAF